jgi:hypothetical protein
MTLAIWAAIQRIGASALSFLGKLSIWQLLLIAALLVAGVQTVRVNRWKAVATHRQQQLVAEQKREAAALAAALKITDLNEALSEKLRKATDEQNRAIAADAHGLSVSGPGKAVCPRLSAPSSDGTRPAKPDAAGPALPPDDGQDLSAVPWNWLVQRSEEHDQLLAEVQAWRTWHDEVLKVWPKK